MWIVYQSQGPARTIGTKVAEYAFRGMAQKHADRLNEQASKDRTSDRYSVRFE